MNSFQGLCPNPIERKLLTHSHASNTKIKEEHQTQKRERHEKASNVLALCHQFVCMFPRYSTRV